MNLKCIPFYFIIGGTVLVSICLAAEYINPTAAAFLWAVPAIILFSYLILNYETNNRKLIFDTNKNVVSYFFIKLIFLLSLWYLLENTDIGVNFCILISFIVFLIAATILYFLIK